jgi:hypothetical protein
MGGSWNLSTSLPSSDHPPFAPHVRGAFPDRAYDEDRKLLPATVSLSCECCGEGAEVRCDSGRYRERVAKWALLHVDCPLRERGKIPV